MCIRDRIWNEQTLLAVGILLLIGILGYQIAIRLFLSLIHIFIGSEALVRWDSPEKGLIPPDDFIPFFEKNDFIIKLDMYVFEVVCKILRKWIDEGKIVHPISVNLSRNHLHHPNFLEEYRKIQQKYEIPDQYIDCLLYTSTL